MPNSSISCLVPARNEAGHLRIVISHVLQISDISEIIIIEGGSTDDTFKVAKDLETEFPNLVRTIKQTGIGKFNAVLDGAKLSTGELVMIWDADGTISLNESRRIIQVAKEKSGAAMGDRLRGTMAPGSMMRANKVGNWVFALLWCPILNWRIQDLLCGTKIFPRQVFESLPGKYIRFDPYGDFALLANARNLGIKIASVTVDYDARSYGKTNIHRWTGGWLLLRFTLKVYHEEIRRLVRDRI